MLFVIYFYFNTKVISINKIVSSINSYFLNLARKNKSEKGLQIYDDPEHDSYKCATDRVYHVMLIL